MSTEWERSQASLKGPIHWRADENVKCRDCGATFIFTKEEQRRLRKELKLSTRVTVNRCAPCRKKRRERKEEQAKRQAEAAKRKKTPHPNEAFFKRHQDG